MLTLDQFLPIRLDLIHTLAFGAVVAVAVAVGARRVALRPPTQPWSDG